MISEEKSGASVTGHNILSSGKNKILRTRQEELRVVAAEHVLYSIKLPEVFIWTHEGQEGGNMWITVLLEAVSAE